MLTAAPFRDSRAARYGACIGQRRGRSQRGSGAIVKIRKSLSLALAGASLTTALVAVSTPAQAVTYLTPKGLLAKLSTAAEAGFSSYDRSKFQYPVDANGDCQDTRAEVLQQETRVKVTFTSASRCYVKYGTWYSWYDGVTAKSASNIQIDHLVPLYEAWTSGARKWNAATRKNFANDLAFPATLTAVSASSNLSKGSKDPAQWLPSLTSSRCKYVIQWMQVKYRWHLTIDSAERSKILSIINTGNCNATVVKLPARATIGYATTTGGGGTGGGGGGSTTDPRYGTCTEAKSHGLGPYYRGIDPEYYWYDDRDNDGIVCE